MSYVDDWAKTALEQWNDGETSETFFDRTIVCDERHNVTHPSGMCDSVDRVQQRNKARSTRARRFVRKRIARRRSGSPLDYTRSATRDARMRHMSCGASARAPARRVLRARPATIACVARNSSVEEVARELAAARTRGGQCPNRSATSTRCKNAAVRHVLWNNRTRRRPEGHR